MARGVLSTGSVWLAVVRTFCLRAAAQTVHISCYSHFHLHRFLTPTFAALIWHVRNKGFLLGTHESILHGQVTAFLKLHSVVAHMCTWYIPRALTTLSSAKLRKNSQQCSNIAKQLAFRLRRATTNILQVLPVLSTCLHKTSLTKQNFFIGFLFSKTARAWLFHNTRPKQ